MYQENKMIKTITFAILHFSVAFSVAYILTGSIGISSAVALVEPIVNTVRLLFSRKAWNRYEKNKSENKIVGASASVRLKFSRRPFAWLKTGYGFSVRPLPSKCQTLK